MPLFNCDCEVNLILTWSASCFIVGAPVENQVLTFTINDLCSICNFVNSTK